MKFTKTMFRKKKKKPSMQEQNGEDPEHSNPKIDQAIPRSHSSLRQSTSKKKILHQLFLSGRPGFILATML